MTEVPYRPPWWTRWKVTSQLAEEFIRLRGEGWTYRAIAERSGVCIETVRHWVNPDLRRSLTLEEFRKIKEKENKEVTRERLRLKYHFHPQVKEAQKRWRHGEKCQEYLRGYRERNRERIREYQRQWMKKNPEKAREYSHRWRAKKGTEWLRRHWRERARKLSAQGRLRYQTDPEYRRARNMKEAERYRRKKMADPEWYEERKRRQRERMRGRYRENPDYREKVLAYNQRLRVKTLEG